MERWILTILTLPVHAAVVSFRSMVHSWELVISGSNSSAFSLGSKPWGALLGLQPSWSVFCVGSSVIIVEIVCVMVENRPIWVAVSVMLREFSVDLVLV